MSKQSKLSTREDGTERGYVSRYAMSGQSPLGVDLAQLPDKSTAEIEALWRNHVGGLAPKQLPKALLVRLLAYRLQVQQASGLPKSVARFLDKVANDLEAGREPALPYPADQKLKPGSVIIREHDGVQHRVMVLGEGFAWNGKTFGSLSAIAKAITGTNWNGQRFFGLKEKQVVADGTRP